MITAHFIHLALTMFLVLRPVQGRIGVERHPFATWPGYQNDVAYTNATGFWVMDVTTGQTSRVTEHSARGARWSPDETSLAYITEEGAFLYDPATRTSHPIPLPPPLQQPPDRVFEWSPDGNRVLFHSLDARGEYIWMYDRSASVSRIVAQTRLAYALWLDNARVLLVSSCGSACRGVEVISVDEGTRRPIFVREPETSIDTLALSPDRTRLLVARTDGTLMDYDLRTGVSQILWRLSDREQSTLVLPSSLQWTSVPQQGPWDPTGRYVAFHIHARFQDPRLVILDTATGRHVTFYNMQHTWSPGGQFALLTPLSPSSRDAWILPLARPLDVSPIHVNGPVASRNLWLDDHTLLVLENAPGSGWTFRLVDVQKPWKRMPSRGLYTLRDPFVRLYPFRQGEGLAFVQGQAFSPGDQPDLSPMLIHISRKQGFRLLVGQWPRKKTWEELHGARSVWGPLGPTPATNADRLLLQGINTLCGFTDYVTSEAALTYALDVLDYLQAHPHASDAAILRSLLITVLQRSSERLPVTFTWLLDSDGEMPGEPHQNDAVFAPEVWDRLIHLYPQHLRPGPDNVRVVTLSDLNGDGEPELMLQHAYSGASTAFDQRCVLAWASGRFRNLLSTANETMNGWWVVGDVDGDGRAEMLAHRGGSGIATYLALPYTVLYRWVDGVLVPHTLLPPTMPHPSRYPDAIALAWQTSTLYAYLGDLDAALQALQVVRKSLTDPSDDLTRRVDPFVLYRYGLLALLNGDPSTTQHVWQDVLARYPDHPLVPFLQELLQQVEEPQPVVRVCARVRASARQWERVEQEIGLYYPGWHHLSGGDVCVPPVLFSLETWSREHPIDEQLARRGVGWQLLANTYDLNEDGQVDPIGVVTDRDGGRDYGAWAFLTEGQTYRPLLVADAGWVTPTLNPHIWFEVYQDLRECSNWVVADLNRDGAPEVVAVCRGRVRTASWTGHRFREWMVEARSYNPQYGPGWETRVRVVSDARWGLLLEMDFIGRGDPPPPSFRRRYRFTTDGPFLVEDADPAKSPALSQALEMLYAHRDPRGALRALRTAHPPAASLPLLLYVRARAASLVGERKLAAWDAYLLSILYPRGPWVKRVKRWRIPFNLPWKLAASRTSVGVD